MPGLEGEGRTRESEEINEGYCFSQAMADAERCLRCQDPACIEGCPVRVPIAEFMQAIAAGDLPGAAALLRGANPLAAMCGRVCPPGSECETKCHMSRQFGPAPIGRMERFVSSWEMDQAVSGEAPQPWRATKIAIIGSGPSGMVCAGELARLGYPVTVYEALHAPGGTLRFGAREFRLPDSILEWELASLERLGVSFVNHVTIGGNIELDHLFSDMGYAAAFIGSGVGQPKFMGIPGEDLNGVYPTNEFLTRINLMQAFDFLQAETPLTVDDRVAVIGCGHSAMDAARSARRLGAGQVMLLHRGSKNELKAPEGDYQRAIEEGVELHWLTHPVEVLGEDGWVTGLKCVRMESEKADDSGVAPHIPIEGSEFVLPTDNVVLSIGARPNPLLSVEAASMKKHARSGLLVDERQTGTGVYRVYAAGDAATGAATVILAAAAGKKAAAAIHSDLASEGA